MGIIPWSPLARGFLAGNRVPQGKQGETVRAKSDDFAQSMYFEADDFAVAERVKQIAGQLSVTPARTFSGSRLTFATNLLAGSTYWALGDEQRTVLAGKLALGSLDGAPLFQLPADQRIYAGGGGSIRPYGWQLAGPLASNKKPIGGRSSLVLNLEGRVKITETIGIVPFVDAGSYYESPVPQLGRTLLYGVGVGLRYYTAFGPLRLDVATPLHKRSADSPIQLYISLGEAF